MTTLRKIVLLAAIVLVVVLYALADNSRDNNPPLPPSPSSLPPIRFDRPIDSNSKYEIPISSPISISDALVSDTKQWPTYRNDQFGFSIKYPPGWGVTNEEFAGDVWFIGFGFSPHDFFFGMSITRDSLEDKIELEKGNDFLRLEEGPKVNGVKITKVVHSLNEYYQENTISYVFTHRDYSFALRIDSEFFRLILPTLRFF